MRAVQCIFLFCVVGCLLFRACDLSGLATPYCAASLGVRLNRHVSAPFFVIFVSCPVTLDFLYYLGQLDI